MHDMYGMYDDGEYNPMEEDHDEPLDDCVSCGSIFESPTARLFCSDLCAEEATLVRYARRCRADGRIHRVDVQEAIDIRMALVLGGGYPRRERQLSAAVRAEIRERDEGRCRICGGEGTEIDHISGSDGNPENLQLLCNRCHTQKTIASFRTVKPGDPDYDEINARASLIMKRIEAVHPQHACDDPDEWQSLSRTLLAQRRRHRAH
ncbi:MAG TPA: HNH endonuclease [Longimicrobium sp.]|nr:HNH endonuclease [Longimicrobium sp.]